MPDETRFARYLQSPTNRWLLGGLLVLALFLASSFLRRLPRGSARGERGGVPLNIRREPATPEARSLLAPLTEGSDVAGWRVTVLEGPRDGLIHVVLRKGADDIEILIAQRQGTTVSAPVVAGPYALFNMGFQEFDRQAMVVMRALADTLRAKAGAPAPPGLGPFNPRR
jgi:hypothetical protein